MGKSNSSIYQRKVHITERMWDNLRKEPLPAEVDLEEIEKRHSELIEKDYLYKLHAKNFGFGKKDIQRLLRYVDKHNTPEDIKTKIKSGEKLTAEEKKKRDRFSRLYLGI
jgi:hypothetical protein